MKKNNFMLGAGFIAGAYTLLRSFSTVKVTPTQGKLEESYTSTDNYVKEQMRRLHIPGASLAIIEGDRVVHFRGFGLARPNGEVPTSQTPFFIGSLTKSITAMAIMQLVEARKVDLDDSIQRYLPWFQVADPIASAQITVRHLLNQTSGLPLLSSETALDNFENQPKTAERFVRALSSEKLKAPPGVKWGYSNHNYNILGLIVEAASGESYTQYIQCHIFEPLEMTHTYTTKAQAQKNNLAVGYRHWFSMPFPAPNMPVPVGALPSGQLISCAEDMAHYLIAHLNGGHYKNVQVLSSAGLYEMHRGRKEISMFGISSGLYGMGWTELDLGGTKTYSHSGNTPDFSAFMAIIPNQKKALIVLFNADPYGLPPITEEIGMGITALVAGQTPQPIGLNFIQWLIRILPLVPFIQVVGILSSFHQLRQLLNKPTSSHNVGLMQRQQTSIPLALNISIAGTLAYLRSSGLLRYFRLFNPDLALIVKISGALTLVWALLHGLISVKILDRFRM